jgi:hypothetical protein
VANPYKINLALPAAVANGISTSQSLSGAGNLTITGSLATGGIATLTSLNCTGRRVGITSAGNDTSLTWTLTGTDRNGNAQSETFAGANTGLTVTSTLDYATVTKIAGSKATASTVTAGTTSVGSTPWNVVNIREPVFNIGIGVSVAAANTPTVTVEYTFDDPNAAFAGTMEPLSYQPPLVWPASQFTSINANTSGNIAFPVFAIRMTVNSGTGLAIMQAIQGGMTG